MIIHQHIKAAPSVLRSSYTARYTARPSDQGKKQQYKYRVTLQLWEDRTTAQQQPISSPAATKLGITTSGGSQVGQRRQNMQDDVAQG